MNIKTWTRNVWLYIKKIYTNTHKHTKHKGTQPSSSHTHRPENFGDEVSLESSRPQSILPLLPIGRLHLELSPYVLQGLVADVDTTVRGRRVSEGSARGRCVKKWRRWGKLQVERKRRVSEASGLKWVEWMGWEGSYRERGKGCITDRIIVCEGKIRWDNATRSRVRSHYIWIRYHVRWSEVRLGQAKASVEINWDHHKRSVT